MNIAFENDVYMQIYTVDDKLDVDYDDADDHLHIQSEWGIVFFLRYSPRIFWLAGLSAADWWVKWVGIATGLPVGVKSDSFQLHRGYDLGIYNIYILLGVTLPVFQLAQVF